MKWKRISDGDLPSQDVMVLATRLDTKVYTVGNISEKDNIIYPIYLKGVYHSLDWYTHYIIIPDITEQEEEE